LPPHCQLHGLGDFRISTAAAEIAGERFTNLLLGWIGIAPQQLMRHQHKPGRTKPALERARLDECALDDCEIAVGVQMLDCGDPLAIEQNRDIKTTGNRRLVDEHCAAAANALPTALAAPNSPNCCGKICARL